MTFADQTDSPAPPQAAAQPDYLLDCLQNISGHYGRSVAATVLTSGLPLQDGQLTLPLVPRSAARVDLEAKIVQCGLSDLVPLELPAILQLAGGYPIVLRGVDAQGGYIIYLPWQKSDVVVAARELEAQYSGTAIQVRPVYKAPDETEGRRRPRPGAWFWDVVREHRRSYGTVVLAAIVINLIALATPLFFMNIYDRVIPNKAMETLWVFVAGLAVAMVFDLLLKISRGQIIDRAGRKVDIQVACSLIEKILNTRLVDKPASTGALANRIQEYEIIREFFSSTTLMLFVDMSFFILFSIVIFILAGWVVAVPLTALVVVVGLSFFMQSRLADVVRRAQDESALRHSILVESISALETIKSIRAEGHILQRWEKYARSAAESSEQAKHLSSVGLNATGFIQQLVSIGVVVAGVYRFADGALSMGAIIAAVMLSNRLVAPLSQIAMMFSRLHYVRLAFGHFDDLMAKADDRPVQAGFVNRPVEEGQVQFRHVEFSYPGATSPILRNFNLVIRPGERVGIVGKIGSGKTTIGRLLTGLYQPDRGEILLDGVDLRQYHPHEVRSAIALVVQDADLFIGTVRDNIVMAKPTARDDEIVWAAKLAGVDAFVAGHPRGYDMHVGERGSNISGGQRQCIALARVFLAQPKLLFLDEPSSSMDLQTERQFIERLGQAIRPEQTVIIATHRQSMLKLVDRLLVIDGGQVVRDGPKDQVLKGLADGLATRTSVPAGPATQSPVLIRKS